MGIRSGGKKSSCAHLEMARQQVAQMGDPRSEELSRRVAKARDRAAREKQQRLELAQKELEKLSATKTSQEAQQEVRVSETDPEARNMKQADGGFAASYNVQISTDATHGMIVGVDVSQSATTDSWWGRWRRWKRTSVERPNK